MLSQINPAHTKQSYVCNIHFNIILYLSLGLPSWFFPSDFHTKTLYTVIILDVSFTLCLSHPSWLDQSNYIRRAVQVMKLLIVQLFSYIMHAQTQCYQELRQHTTVPLATKDREQAFFRTPTRGARWQWTTLLVTMKIPYMIFETKTKDLRV
jgi:hypothetical protein